MKVAYLIELNENFKSGLYYSIISKIKSFKENNPQIKVDVYNIGLKQPFLVRKVFEYLNYKKYPTRFQLDGLECNSIYLNIKMFDYVKSKLFAGKHNSKTYDLLDYKELEQYDIISAHYTGPMLAAYNFKLRTGKKFCITFHGSDLNRTPFESFDRVKFYKEILRESSANFFVSEALLDKSLKITETKKKAYVLYNGVDRRIFKKNNLDQILILKQDLKIDNKRVVGFVGNMVDVKNVLILPRLFDLIQKKVKDVTFLIIGNGILESELKRQLTDLQIDIAFFGRVDRSKIIDYYSIMDVMVLPSKNEGLPMVLLEALACCVPCVGSNVGGIPEILGDENTFELNSEFLENISNKVVSYLENPGIGAFDLETFDLNISAKKEGEIYHSILV